MAKKENLEVTVDAPEKPEEKEITVELDENNKPVKQEENKSVEPKYVTVDELEKERKKFYYNQRKQQDEIENLKRQLTAQPQAQPQQEPRKEAPVSEWDAKLQNNWKGTVEELADARAEAKFNELSKRLQEQSRIEYDKQRNFNLLEENKKKVLDKHKELFDDESDKSGVYRQGLQEHPEYLSNPFGPVLAMRDMEDKLKENGQLDNSTQKIVEKEVMRQARAGAGTIPKGTSSNGRTSITLTKDQKELCDANGWKYQDYAANLKMLSTNKGVEA